MKITAFAGSNSCTSINKQLVKYASSLISNEIEVIDFNDYNIPTYSIDIEKNEGFSEDVKRFYNQLIGSEILIISFSEHNASFTAVLKSYMDWCSRIDPKFLTNKKIFALSTSPGGYGGRNALEAGIKLVTRLGGTVVDEFALPKFNENFSNGKISNAELDAELKSKIDSFNKHL